LQKEHNISPGDFPDVNKMRANLENADFTKFQAIKPRLLEVVENMLQTDIARLMAQIPKEEQAMAIDASNNSFAQRLEQTVRGGAFEAESEAATPFGFGKGEGFDKGSGSLHQN
jgi:EH domain-containing protein 1